MSTLASVTATTKTTTNGKPAKDKPKSLIIAECELLHGYIFGVEAHLLLAQTCHANGNTDRAKDAERTATVALLALDSEIEQLLSDLASRSDSLAERLTGEVFHRDGAHAATDESESDTVDTDAALREAIDATFGPEDLTIGGDISALDAGD